MLNGAGRTATAAYRDYADILPAILSHPQGQSVASGATVGLPQAYWPFDDALTDFVGGGPAFTLETRTGAVIARRNHRVFVAAT